ncbi:hypothetical protein MFUL124B02_11590 [Myxococcus fulvus 124B02]|nr:hypothetical protein MFUL124B02_11590 [Myxococcus fulvus 124B02]
MVTMTRGYVAVKPTGSARNRQLRISLIEATCHGVVGFEQCKHDAMGIALKVSG